jgi:hypothetical protein
MRRARSPARRGSFWFNKWLKQQGLAGMNVSPLLEARVAARGRAWWFELAALALTLAALLGYGVWVEVTDWQGPGAEAALAELAGLYLVIQGCAVAAIWYERRADHRIATMLPGRLPRSAEVNLLAVPVTRHVLVAIVIYCGGLLAGAAAIGFASSTRNRLLAIGFVIGLLLFAGFAAARFAMIALRPAIAVGELSLREDDLLRSFDLSRLVFPYPLLLALWVVSARIPDKAPEFQFYGWAVLIAVSLAGIATRRAPRVYANAPPQSPHF